MKVEVMMAGKRVGEIIFRNGKMMQSSLPPAIQAMISQHLKRIHARGATQLGLAVRRPLPGNQAIPVLIKELEQFFIRLRILSD